MNKNERKIREDMIKCIQNEKGKKIKLLIDTEFESGTQIYCCYNDETRELNQQNVELTVLNALVNLWKYCSEILDMDEVQVAQILLVEGIKDQKMSKRKNEESGVLN